MERIIQPYPSSHPDSPARLAGHHAHQPIAPAPPAKTAGEFARALRRRGWLVTVAPLAMGLRGAVYVVRQPPVYRAAAQIEIIPPRFDAGLAAVVVNAGVANFDRETVDRYVP